MQMPKIVGILNITSDSFSDGGLYLEPQAAIVRAKQLISQGADFIDLGAESSRPGAQKVPDQEQIERLTPVIQALVGEKISLSVDTYRPEVIQKVLELGVEMINDITALKDPAAVEIVKRYNIPAVIMYSRSPGPHADRMFRDHRGLLEEITAFFAERIAALTREGIHRENIILDPGMGFFLGGNPEPSLTVLKHLKELRRLGCRLYLCTSRKSFIGSLIQRPVPQRDAGTLATEIWAGLQGVDFLRTHEVEPLRDALTILQAIEKIH